MTRKIVLISHAIRGALWSAQRRADIEATHALFERVRKKGAVTPTVPYVLYAAVCEDIVGARVRGEAGYKLMPHREVWLFGPEICDGMREEIERAWRCGLTVRSFLPRLYPLPHVRKAA